MGTREGFMGPKPVCGCSPQSKFTKFSLTHNVCFAENDGENPEFNELIENSLPYALLRNTNDETISV